MPSYIPSAEWLTSGKKSTVRDRASSDGPKSTGRNAYVTPQVAADQMGGDSSVYAAAGMAFASQGGDFGVLTNLETLDENGFYQSLDVTYMLYTTSVEAGDSLGTLSEQEMVIMTEIYPYDYTSFDESNTEITLFAAGYNGLTDPTITETSRTDFEEASTFQSGMLYNISLDTNEISGLRDKFGFQTGYSLAGQVETAVGSLATDIVNSYRSKRHAYKRTKGTRIPPFVFSSLGRLLTVTGSATGSATTTTFTGY